jgi:serine/threonine-protein kinase HipA
VQLKFSAVKDATGGLTIPARGIGGHWVIKLPSGAYDGVPENEYAMMTLARAIGIDVPEVHLHPLDEINGLPEGIGKLAGHALAVKRFDRTDQGPAHIEDFAQVFGVYPEAKYGKASYRNIASVIWIETGADGLAEYIRRLIFNALIGNADMHLKNWSLIYRDKRTPALAPAYDLVSTIAFVADDTMALTFGHSRRWTDLSLAEVTYFAGKARLPEKLVLDITKETVSRFHEVWASERTHLSLTQHGRNVIADHLKRLPLAADVS